MIEFGARVEGVAYVDRPSAYAIISGDANTIALVHTRKGYFLPGGGVEAGEELESALRREIVEETGYESRIVEKLTTAAQYVYDREQGVYYRKVGHFFRAALTQKIAEPVEERHELTWRSPAESARTLAQEFQAWAVRQAFRIGERN
jgi:8-oxo-dGTP diphosphatase